MSKSYKRWSKKEKLIILRAAEQEGIIQTCRKFDVSSATFYHWKKVYDTHGEAGFSETKSPEDKRFKNLEPGRRAEENRRLKKLLVDKDLALETQKELLKKKFGTDDPRRI
jgi:putative transposase